MLKFPGGRTSFEIINVFLKPKSSYIRVECRVPGPGCREDTMFFAGFGAEAKRKMYFVRVHHLEKAVAMYEVSTIFYLQPTFEALEESKSTLSAGIQFMKIENKEELEHRKRNINYLLKVHNKEGFVKMSYTAVNEGTLLQGLAPFGTADISENTGNFNSKCDSVRDIIFRARVVNLGNLRKVRPSEDVESVLREMAIHFRGRFLLKNKYYEECLQATRKAILAEIVSGDTFPAEKICEIPEEHLFLLEELCDRRERAYVLKGYDEGLGLEDEALEIESSSEKVAGLLKELNMASVGRLASLSRLSKAEVADVLTRGPFAKLSNGCYTYSGTEAVEHAQKILNLFVKRQSVRKTDVLKALRESCGGSTSFEQALEVLDTFCEKKGALWVLKSAE